MNILKCVSPSKCISWILVNLLRGQKILVLLDLALNCFLVVFLCAIKFWQLVSRIRSWTSHRRKEKRLIRKVASRIWYFARTSDLPQSNLYTFHLSFRIVVFIKLWPWRSLWHIPFDCANWFCSFFFSSS